MTSTKPEPSVVSSSVPSSRKRRLRRDEIVVAATKMFAERGYEGTSMGDLASSVGLRKASLFHHFESKDALYAAVLDQLVDATKGAILAALSAQGSFLERLDTLTDAITGLLGSQPHAARLFVREAMDWGPLMRGELGTQIKATMKHATEFVRAGQTEGVFDGALDPEHLIISLVGVYFIPFVLDRTIEDFTGESPFAISFVDRRRQAVREQIRALFLPH